MLGIYVAGDSGASCYQYHLSILFANLTFRGILESCNYFLKLSLPSTTMEALPSLLYCTATGRLRWIWCCVCKLYQCHRLLRKWCANSPTSEKGYSGDLLHLPSAVSNEDESILFRIHCEHIAHVCYFRLEGPQQQWCSEE